jgi:hypothetical protein
LTYVLPKRAFPDARSCDWFRTVAGAARPESSEVGDGDRLAPAPSPQPGSVTLVFRLRYRDYLDRSFASWFTRGMAIFFVLIMLGAFIAASMNPPEHPVYSAGQVFAFFVLPFLVVIALMVFILGATQCWLSHFRVEQTVTLSDTAISEVSAGGQSVMNWETPTRFKETPWSFIVWWPRTQGWLQLPKRAFSTVDGSTVAARSSAATRDDRRGTSAGKARRFLGPSRHPCPF